MELINYFDGKYDKWGLPTHTQYYKGRCLARGVTFLRLLPSNGRLLCLLGVTVSVLSSVRCSAHTDRKEIA
jgi:hypothetical protein